MDSYQPLTKEEAAFLAKASTSFLTRMRLEPWVQETAESSSQDRQRHRFQTPWSSRWELAAGPLQGAFTDQQRLYLIRNHEAELQRHLEHMYHLADLVRTCVKCNRRLVLTEARQDCPSCLKGGVFSAENRMCLGPRAGTERANLSARVTVESELAAQAMRVDLHNTIASATDMEINLLRPVTPVLRVSLACIGFVSFFSSTI